MWTTARTGTSDSMAITNISNAKPMHRLHACLRTRPHQTSVRILSTGTPIPAQWTCRRRGQDIADIETRYSRYRNSCAVRIVWLRHMSASMLQLVYAHNCPPPHVYVHVCTHVCAHVYTLICTHVYTHVGTHVCTQVCTHVYTHVHVNVCTHVYPPPYGQACLYTCPLTRLRTCP